MLLFMLADVVVVAVVVLLEVKRALQNMSKATRNGHAGIVKLLVRPELLEAREHASRMSQIKVPLLL